MVAEDYRAAAIEALSSSEAENQSAASSSSSSSPGSSPLRAFLIEANTSPDVSHSTAVTKALVPLAAADLFALLLDEGHAQDPVPATRHATTPCASAGGGRSSSVVATGAPGALSAASVAPAAATSATSDARAKAEKMAPEPATEAIHLSAPLLPQRLCADLFPYAGPLDQAQSNPTPSRSSADNEATAGGDSKADDVSGDAGATSPWALAPGFPARPCWQLWYVGDGDELCEGADSNDRRAATASAQVAAAATATTPNAPSSSPSNSASGASVPASAMSQPSQMDTEPTTLEALVRAVPELKAVMSAGKESANVSSVAVAAEVAKKILAVENPEESKRSPAPSDDEL